MEYRAGEVALERAIQEEVDSDSLFLEKCAFHQEQMDKFNDTGKSPMELADTPAGQVILDAINARVSAAMIAKYGE
tara:strand:- start:1810 stop:2037 length:228 start_codon:yes stop_codon:yes gene_type:complete